MTDPADIFYLTGYNTFEVAVHTCLVCTDTRLVLQVPSIETGPAVVTARVTTGGGEALTDNDWELAQV